VTVVLSGEGADEDFAGYEIYRYMLGLEAARALAPGGAGLAARGLGRLGLGKAARYARLAGLPLAERYRGVSLPDLDALEPLLLPGVRAEAEAAGRAAIEPLYRASEGAHPLERMLMLDLELWLPDDILLKADKMTMAASLELRVPFLDPEVVELAAGLPPRLKVGLTEGKKVLRRAVRDYVPREILERPKRGFPTPLAHLFRSALGDLAAEVLAGRDASGHGIWSEARVARALAEHRAGRADHHRALWTVLVYELWHRTFAGSAARPADVAAAA
jgi:asparagine synthase (glutamine-hydrolysing)